MDRAIEYIDSVEALTNPIVGMTAVEYISPTDHAGASAVQYVDELEALQQPVLGATAVDYTDFVESLFYPYIHASAVEYGENSGA